VWTTLAGLARETSRIRLGSLVTSATFRHPGALAIVLAQVDAMSQGRIEFGIGAGYFEPEHLAYDPKNTSAASLKAKTSQTRSSWYGRQLRRSAVTPPRLPSP
jgi:alkanesulfonate monooxygenase SsuD/methylene tetrahydromethanopterin reductase-like flavin-dependent oxidoreductase (luciferase family)